jgi:hypothetical protein
MIQNGISKVAKSCSVFECKYCDYTTCKKYSWDKHVVTKKHKTRTMVYHQSLKVANETTDEKINCKCGKSYKFKSGYYRHKTVCTWKEPKVDSASAMLEALTTLTQVLIPSLIQQMTKVNQQEVSHTLHQHNIINLNVFLNEQCAKAMSIQEFAKQMRVSLEDLDKTKSECIKNVVLKNLQPLSITERPFHCADADTSEWYVHDQVKGWECDTGIKILETTEHAINCKWQPEFEAQHPNWGMHETQQDQFVRIASHTACKMSEKDRMHILKDISDTVGMDKLLLL